MVRLSNFLNVIQHDPRVGPSHISLYVALIGLWYERGCKIPILVKRSEIMPLAKIGGASTYHKVLKDLVEIGCFRYEPGFDRKGSRFYLKEWA